MAITPLALQPILGPYWALICLLGHTTVFFSFWGIMRSFLGNLVKKPILFPITIIFVYIWVELRATTNGNLYNKMGSEEGLSWFSWFWPFSVVFLTNFGLKMSFFLSNTPKMTHSDKFFHMRPIGASEYHFGEYKHIRLDSNDKNAFSGIFGFPPKNFGGPYLGSPTWHKGRSVLKIIVWRSSLLTNIFLPSGKHIKAYRA